MFSEQVFVECPHKIYLLVDYHFGTPDDVVLIAKSGNSLVSITSALMLSLSRQA